MSLQVSSVTELSADQVEQALDFIKQLVQEEQPSADLRTGVLRGVLLLASAQHAAVNREEIDRVRRSSSLLAIEADPTLAVDDVVDRVISNYLISRQSGAQAVGEITIVVSKLSPVTIPSGALFEGGGRQFAANSSYVAKTTSSNVLSSTDRLLSQTNDGNYSFNISVTAVTTGAAGLLTKDTSLTPVSQVINFVKAYATSDFTDGRDTETNAELIARVQQGLSAQTLSGRSDMAALLRANYPDVVNSSIIGYGDAEMLRDQHSVLPISFGGRVDWYVRTQSLPQQVGLTKTATLVQKTSDGFGIWQFSLARNDAPGFYDVMEIKFPGENVAGSFAITQEVRSNNLTPIQGELLPDITTVAEGAFSRYQAAVVQFKDDQTNTSSLTAGSSTKDYSVTVRAMQNMASIQTTMASRTYRNYGGDVLIKAPVPCFVSLAFTLEAPAGAPIPDPYAIQSDLANYVNNLGFTGRLHASALLDLVHNRLSGKIAVSAIDMNGEILRPDGTVRRLRSSEVLIVPDESERMVSARTVGFFLDPNNVLISARTVNIPEV